MKTLYTHGRYSVVDDGCSGLKIHDADTQRVLLVGPLSGLAAAKKTIHTMLLQPNAHFWAFINGDAVRITLKPGQEIRHYQAWRHEEGCWSSIDETWHFDGSTVLYTCCDGTDCDGRLSYHAPLSDLAACRSIGLDPPVMFAQWSKPV